MCTERKATGKYVLARFPFATMPERHWDPTVYIIKLTHHIIKLTHHIIKLTHNIIKLTHQIIKLTRHIIS